MDAPGDPWRVYTKTRLRPGLVYPLRQQELRDVLLELQVKVGSVQLMLPIEQAWRSRTPVRILSARRVPDDVAGKWNSQEFAYAFQSVLTLYACPVAAKPAVRAVLLDQALPAAASWLRLATGHGSAWQASEHEWEALWEHPHLRYAEDRFRG